MSSDHFRRIISVYILKTDIIHCQSEKETRNIVQFWASIENTKTSEIVFLTKKERKKESKARI